MVQLTKEFVINELQKSCEVKLGGGQANIVCPFHEDKDPSLSVSLGYKVPPGVFFCFGCKASGSWNTLANKLGLTTVGENSKYEDTSYHVNKRKIEIFQPTDEEYLSLSPLDFKWKKYSIEFLQKFNVQKMWHDKYTDYYLYFPVTYIGDYKGYIRGRIYKESYGPKYWFNLSEKIFYPIDYLLGKDTRVIVLVEGVADALRLIRYNIPTLAVLGTYFKEDLGLDILETLMVDKVVLCFDGDNPGKEAAIKTAKLLDKHLDVRIFPLPKDEDPDSVDYKYIAALKAFVLRLGGKLLNKGV